MNQRNLTLLTDFYELTMMQGYFKHKDAIKPLSLTYFTAIIHSATALPSAQA